MTTRELLSEFLRLDIKLWVDGERLRYNAPQGVMTPELQAELVKHKAEVIACLRASTSFAEQGLVTGPMPVVPLLMMNYADAAPQEWWHAIEALVEIPHVLGPAQLRETVERLLAHHDGLRLRLIKEENNYRMFIAPSEENVFLEKDLSGLTEAEQDDAIEAAIPEQWASLDFASGPLLRIVFFDLGPQRHHRLLLIVHHFAVDAFSVRILLNDFYIICQAVLTGAPVELPPKTTSIKKWAEWMHNYVQSEAGRAEFEYWKSLPWARVRPTPVDHPEVLESPYGHLTESLSEAETQALLSKVTAANHVPLMDVFLTACVIAYTKHTSLQLLAITVVHHGRNAVADGLDLLRTVGNLYTSYPLLLDISSNLFRESPAQALNLVAEHRKRIPNEGASWCWVSYNAADIFASTWNVVFNYLGQVKSDTPAQPQMFRQIQRPIDESAPQSYKVMSLTPHSCTTIIEDGQLKVTWEYFSALDEQATIERLVHEYVAVLRSFIGMAA